MLNAFKLRQSVAIVLMLSLTGISTTAMAASCCGGGSASSLLLPKVGSHMIDLSFDLENYEGFWTSDGVHNDDPPGSELSQSRLNAGLAYRLNDNWQASVVLPYIWNNNVYSGLTSYTDGLGDAVASIWYEAFDAITCVYKVNSISDLKPSIYYGLSMTIPTGISAYGDVANSFDITGRGFYRLDASLLLDKTVFPWNMSFQYIYGSYLERPVNREYGNYIEPYDKKPGDRKQMMLSFGYSDQIESGATVTYTLAYTDLSENTGEIDGQTDPTSGFEKKSYAFTVAYANFDKDWIYKFTVSSAQEGKNFPKTDIITIGVSHVFF